jgi:membrane protease YdiL (CAAX protease family)
MQQEQIPFGLSDGQTYIAPAPETLPPHYEPETSPNNPPWGLLAAFGTWAGSILLLVLCSNIAVTIYYLSVGTRPENTDAIFTDPNAVLSLLGGTIPAHLLTLILCVVVGTAGFKFSLRDTLGAKWGGYNIGYCILTVIGFYALFAALVGLLGIEDNELSKMLASSRAAAFMVSFLAVVTAPIVEEFVHRGILYSAVQRFFGAPFAIVLVTLLFAGIHFLQYRNSITAILMITILSLGLTLIRWKSGNLLPCIAVHMIFNGVQAALLLLQPYFEQFQPPAETTGALLRLFY